MGKLWYQPNKTVFGNKNPNWKGGKIKHICKLCKNEYFKFPSQANGRSNYCSKICFFKRHYHKPTKDGKGYIWIYKPTHPNSTPNGYVREHRLVIEKELGRFLTNKEVVHHINKIKSDNRLENLILFKKQSDHIKHHHTTQ